jgi:hypothetical protein
VSQVLRVVSLSRHGAKRVILVFKSGARKCVRVGQLLVNIRLGLFV